MLRLLLVAAIAIACGPPPEPGTTPADPQSVEDTAWRLLELEGEPINPEGPQGEPTLTLDSGSGQAAGTGGCNRFTGTYTLDGDGLTIGQVAATRMACPEGMDLEHDYFDALTRVRRYALDAGHLHLYDQDGALLARFEADPS